MTDTPNVVDTTNVTPSVDAAAIAAAVAAELKNTAPVVPVSTAAPAAVAPATETAPVEIGKVEPFKFAPTNDVGLDIALEYVAGYGLNDTHPAIVAASQGDFTQLETYLEAVKAPGFKKYVDLAKEAVNRQKTTAETHVTKTNEAIFAVFDGQDNWNKVSAWARENATPEELEELNAMLRSGPMQAKAASMMILQAYTAKVGGLTKEAKNPTAQAGTNGGPQGEGPKPVQNRRSLVSEIEGLRRKYGDNFTNTHEYQALHAQFENR
ncbi:head scaffolding protein [Caulobacter phage Lullwater]|uniref:Scaffold protein n=1 Tax=Caulobacter phage Lullwater TaxID=2024607 RepID=A0A291LC40_9CAUD|nr:head scaffolding protein [Caulobacter phage Lullwater]ATI16340.1 scaffold protein [Caulobacter phage Lullwater]